MDGQGAGSCVMFGSVPSSPSFLVKLSIAGRGAARKGGSRMLIPDLVVMAKVGYSGFGVSLLLIVESIWEYCSRSSLRWVVTCHLTNHLGIGHILQFETTLLLRHSAAFPLREKWKNLNIDVSLVAPSA
ncbi:hypothetical protein Tco_1508625, partial [Tanacetum coccineum]